jgi:hypothetical protein
MKTYKKSIFKFTAVFLFVLAMILPANLSATSGNRHRDGKSGHRDRDGRRGNVDRDYTGETGVRITEGRGSEGGNCGHGPNQHAGNACGGDTHTDSIPLDGGLGILVLGAAAFGVRKLRGNKNDKK